MTSVAVHLLHPFEQNTSTTSTYHEKNNVTTTSESFPSQNSVEEEEEEDVIMTDTYSQYTLVENGFDDQDVYNAEIESTVVEPPQSDAVQTQAPSTIVDELEYEELEYEEEEEGEEEKSSGSASKVLGIHRLHQQQDSDSYKALPTHQHSYPQQVHRTPPPPESSLHPQIFSPASRMIPIARPSTPLGISHLHGDDDQVYDDWPICLYTPTGQEYILFRSDGDTEALFEDSWLKSQSLESLFSSIRQTLENELSLLTNSFNMDEMILTIPDLEVSIAEDNCYTRDITLQDLVNLINALCEKNGVQRERICKLQLTLQPRFIARFNQLVSHTSQPSELPKKRTFQETEPEGLDDEEHIGHEGDGQDDPEQGTEGELQEVAFPEEDDVDEREHPDVQDHRGPLIQDDDQTQEDQLGQDEEDVPYEEEYEGDENTELQEFGDEPSDNILPISMSEVVEVDTQADTLGPEEDVLDYAEEDELYEENDEEYDPTLQSAESLVNEMDGGDTGDTEDDSHQQVTTAETLQEMTFTSTQRESDSSNVDEDDLISYEEAADQVDDGQDYRQQYIHETAVESMNGRDIKPESKLDDKLSPEMGKVVLLNTPASPTSKRPPQEATDSEPRPPFKRAKT